MKLLLPLTLLLMFPFIVDGQTPSDRPLVTVSGQAEILVTPDEVVFKVRVVTVDKDLLAAQKRNDDVVRKVITLARSYQIPPSLIQTGYIDLDERYSDEEATRKPSVFLGYAITKKIAIILQDVSKAEQLLADIFKAGITGIDGVEFRSRDLRKYKDQARAQAMKAAQEKATAMAREIGQTIGKAHLITEQDVNPYMGASNNITRGIVGTYSDEPSTIALGQISVTARVVVAFELK